MYSPTVAFASRMYYPICPFPVQRKVGRKASCTFCLVFEAGALTSSAPPSPPSRPRARARARARAVACLACPGCRPCPAGGGRRLWMRPLSLPAARSVSLRMGRVGRTYGAELTPVSEPGHRRPAVDGALRMSACPSGIVEGESVRSSLSSRKSSWAVWLSFSPIQRRIVF